MSSVFFCLENQMRISILTIHSTLASSLSFIVSTKKKTENVSFFPREAENVMFGIQSRRLHIRSSSSIIDTQMNNALYFVCSLILGTSWVRSKFFFFPFCSLPSFAFHNCSHCCMTHCD